MKKLLLFGLLLAVLASSMVFARGADQPSSGGGANTIEMWHVQDQGQGPSIMERAADRFRRANPNFTANIIPVANDAYKQRLAVAMNAGRTPDIFHSWSGGPMYEYVKNNVIADLTPYMNANNYKNRLLDGAVAQATYQGKIWGVPAFNIAICMVYYNKEIFQRLNIAVPTTLREFEAACDKLKANGVTPFSLANLTRWTGSMYFMYLASRRGGTEPFIKAVDGSGSFTDPSFIFAGEKIQEWVNKGYFLPGFNGLDWDSGQARAPMYRGDTAMLIMGSWFVSQAQGEDAAFYSKMGMFAFPRDEQGSGNGNSLVGTLGDNFLHISASSRHPAQAFDLISRVNDDDAVRDWVADGRIPPVKGVTLTNPLMNELFGFVQRAPDIQLWYDQSLSPDVAQVHLITLQEMFGLSKNPRAAAQELQDAQAAYLRQR